MKKAKKIAKGRYRAPMVQAQGRHASSPGKDTGSLQPAAVPTGQRLPNTLSASRSTGTMLLPAHHAGMVRRASTMADAQNTLGNSRISHMLETGAASTRGIGPSNDAYEREAGQDTPSPERGRTAGTAQGSLGSGSMAQPFVQRLRSDFQVRGHIHETTSHWAYFDRASSMLTDDQRRNVELFSAGLSGPSQPVTLIGFASEEGDPGFNARLTEARIDAVARILIGRGHDAAAITRIPRPTASRGRIRYRQWRAVEMLTGGAGQSLVPDCSREGPSQPSGSLRPATFVRGCTD